MRIGRLNNPTRELLKEVRLTAELGFDYLELTLEPPQALSDDLDAAEVGRWLRDAGLGVVGHTAYYLPIADSFPRVRQAAVDQLRADLDFLAMLPCDRSTVHPNRGQGIGYGEVERLRLLADSYAPLVAHGEQVGVRVLCENLKGFTGDPALLKRYLFDPLPGLGLNLDLAHAGLGAGENRMGAFLEQLGDRLAHVHLSDNDGQNDLHQPLGAGRLPLPRLVKRLRGAGYDDTITLEVFVDPPEYLALSRELLVRWWSKP